MGAQWGYNQIDGLKNGWRGGGVCCGLVIQNEREPLGIESVCVCGEWRRLNVTRPPQVDIIHPSMVKRAQFALTYIIFSIYPQ